MDLSNAEIRVLGCLLEKQHTTPDHYPLSLNSLRLACNQATNREPVVEYDEGIIRDALHRLERRGYTRLASGRGSRAPKYRHLLSQALPMSEAEQAIMCVLMLRGPQTPGELKQRSERIHPFAGLDEVHQTLTALIDRGLLARLDRRPGQKEERYTQLLSDHPSDSPNGAHSSPVQPDMGELHAGMSGMGETLTGETMAGAGESSAGAGMTSTVAATERTLHDRVALLERQVAELQAALTQP